MLWSPALLLLLVGAAFANTQSAWKNGKEYTYKIKSRTLASFKPQSKQYTGILMEADLSIQPNGQDTLRGKILQPRYSRILTHLENGLNSEVPEDKLDMQTYPLSGEPFEIKTNNGIVKDLVVSKKVTTWEVNIIKSIVSQLQLDVHGVNSKKSEHDHLPEDGKTSAMFNVTEDSVSGRCEVNYDISPLSELMIEKNPELVPKPELSENSDAILIVKSKNYDKCHQRAYYNYNVNGRNDWEHGNNERGRFLSRSSVSHIVVTGNLNSHTIQYSVTDNKVILSRNQEEEDESGIVASKVQLILQRIKDTSEPIAPLNDAVSTGNLVFDSNNPFANPEPRHSHQYIQNDKNKENSNQSNEMNDNENHWFLQSNPSLMEAPYNSMLSYILGHSGKSNQDSNKIDVVKSAKNIAQQIGNELHRSSDMQEEQTLEKLTILIKLVRLMNAEQIAEIQRDLYEIPQSSNQLNQGNENQDSRRNVWIVFRDAVAQSGTGPALVNIKQWLESKKIENNEAANVIDTLARSTLIPTPEYMNAFFELVTMQTIKSQPALRDAAIMSFTDLVRHAISNKKSAFNRYPLQSFGKLFSKNNNDLHSKYFPYLIEELNTAISTGDSKTIQLYSLALGNVAHPRILSVFEQYIEGRKPVTLHQRLVMLLSMQKLAIIHPKNVRSVLYKIYSNSAEHHEIRIAAVYLLIRANPPTSMLQRIAEYTNHDSNKHVKSAVKSAIDSLAHLYDKENTDLSDAAKAALPLLTAEKFGPQYSKLLFASLVHPSSQSGVHLEGSYIGSEDSVLPKALSFSIESVYDGLKVPRIELGMAVSSVKNLWQFVQQKLNSNLSNNKEKQAAEQQKYSPENIAKLLGIHGDEFKQVEGFIAWNAITEKKFWSFDNHTLEKMPQQLKQWSEATMEKDFEETNFKNYEVVVSFPTETGYRFFYTLKVPSVTKVKGQSQPKSQYDSIDQYSLPKSLSVSRKINFAYGIKIQKRLGFVAAFEHQEYMGGFDQDFQIQLPMKLEVEYNVDKREARMKVQPITDEQGFKILQFQTQPYISRHDILDLQPVLNDKNTRTINKDKAMPDHAELKDKNDKLKLQFNWEKQQMSASNDSELKEKNTFGAIQSLVYSITEMCDPHSPEHAEYQKYSIKAFPSSDMSAEIKVSYDTMITDNDNDKSDSVTVNAKAPYLEKNLNEKERKQKLLQQATRNINSAEGHAVDIELKLNDDSQTSLSLTTVFADSNIDPKTRALLFVTAKNANNYSVFISAELGVKSPNLELLDFEEILKANTKHEFDVEISYHNYDNNNEDHQKMTFEGTVKQTEEFKNEIRQTPEAKACIEQENQNGNKMTKECEEVKNMAKMINAGDIEMKYDSNSPLERMFNLVLNMVVDMPPITEDNGKDSKVNLSFKQSLKTDKVDVTITAADETFNIQITNPIKGNPTYEEDDQDALITMLDRGVCSLDKTQVTTLDKHRYSLQLGKCWHVVMTTYLQGDPDSMQLKLEIPEDMHISILARETENDRKEFKITLGNNVVELSSTEPSHINTIVNGKDVQATKTKSYREVRNGEVLFELFELSEKSMKLISDKYDVEVVYDGTRAEVKVGEMYRDSVRGLCGDFNGETEDDQRTPKNCLLQNSQEFVATYALVNDVQCEGPARQNAEKAKTAQCLYKTIEPGNVINEEDTDYEDKQQGNNNMKTLVIKTDDQICFSKQRVPMCGSDSITKVDGITVQEVEFHCVPRNSISEKVAASVERGVKPDLSQKSVTEVRQIPVKCKA